MKNRWIVIDTSDIYYPNINKFSTYEDAKAKFEQEKSEYGIVLYLAEIKEEYEFEDE